MSTTTTTIDPEHRRLGEVAMVGRNRWEEIHRRARAGGSIPAIARELKLDRKTGTPLSAADGMDAISAGGAHGHVAGGARGVSAAARGGYSAQVLFQELRRREYGGSYETVKRFVRPLRAAQLHAAVTRTRFDTYGAAGQPGPETA